MTTRISLAVVLATSVWAQSPQSQNGGQGVIVPTVQTASIAGTVVSESGKQPLGGAVVTAYRKTPQLPVYRVQGVAAPDGTFTLTSLPSGTYNLCVQVAGSALLDPCSWAGAPTSVTVADGQQSSGTALSVKGGGTLKVVVNDPSGHLQAQGNNGPAHVLMVLVSANAPAIPLPMTKNDASGLEHTLTIPMDTTYKLMAFSKEVTMSDPDQKAVPAGGGGRDVLIPSTGPQQLTLTFKVTGKQ